MSEPCPNVFSMIRYRAIQVETLADALGQELSCAPADPFAEDLVLTRTGAIGRWLAQRLSSHLGESGHGDGICARVRFLTVPQFATLIRPGEDPWSSDSLLPHVMDAIDQVPDQEQFAQVRAYLGEFHHRPHRRIGLARSTSNRFAAYATWNQDMLRSWLDEDFVGKDGSPLDPDQVWQAYLWNRVCEQVGTTPWADADHLCDQVQSSASRFARITLFAPDLLRPVDEKLLVALDQAHPVTVYSTLCASQPLSHSEFDRVSTKLNQQLTFTTSVMDRLVCADRILPTPCLPTSLLGSIQHRLATGQPTAATWDDSVQIHNGYGDQQAEILADLLLDLLEKDPHLEPRDILVLVHRMDVHQGLLDAFFHFDDSPHSSPRHRIRASVSIPETDTIADLLVFLMGLIYGRATAEDLLRLTSFPSVMSQFGFSRPDLDKISTLVSSSGIRWGLNPAHRRSQHMESFAQNTWMAGLGRMVLGVGLSEDDLAFTGTVLALDGVESDTVRLVEALGQIIAHVRMCCETWTAAAEPAQWASRFHATLDYLIGTSWEATSIGTIIADLGSSSSPPLNLAEVEAWFMRLQERHAWRSSFLNGDLGLTELGTMSLVPHKVIVVFGLDADLFPHPGSIDGDDLVGHTMEDARIKDHQIFYDALMAAREKFIAVYSGFDPATAAPTPTPTPLLDLLSLCGSGSEHALIHVHSPGQSIPPPRTSPALVQSESRPETSPAPPPSEVEIDDLGELFANPASYWLRRNAGVLPSVLKETDPIATELPIALSALDKWQIVTRMIRLLLALKSPEAIIDAELRRGTLPPGQIGTALAQDCLRQASAIVSRAKPFLDQPLGWRTISLSTDGVPDLVGQIPVHGPSIVETLAGKVQPRQEIGAWAKILSLQIAYPDQTWRAVLVGNRGTVTLTAPDPRHARHHLDSLRRIHLKGLTSALPLPPSASAQLAAFMARNLPWNMIDIERRLGETWAREPAWSLLWPNYTTMMAEPPLSDEDSPDESFTSRFAALAHGVYVPLMKAGGVS